MVFDLTLMFGPGNEPATVAEFEAMFPTIDPAYNAGELRSAGVTEAVSEGRNILKTQPVFKSGSDIKADALSLLYSPVIAEQQYTFSCNSVSGATSWRWGVKAYDTNGNVISDSAIATELTRITFSLNGYYWNSGTNAYNNTTNTTDKTFTFTPHFTGFVRVFICFGDATTSTVVSNAQLERGTTATEYTPYRSPVSLPIPAAVQQLPGYGWSAGTVFNYVDYTRKVYVQNVGKYTITGDMIASGVGDTVGDAVNWRCYMNDQWEGVGAGNTYKRGVCNLYTVATQWNQSGDKLIAFNYGQAQLWIRDSSVTSIDDIKARLNATPCVVVYPLATPIETDISSLLTDDNLIEVEPGGTLTFKNQHGDDFRLPVPNSETFIIDIQEAVSNG